jgi:hypothetical protein
MIYKFHFSISGNKFFPEEIIDKIQGNFVIVSYFSPNDKKFEGNDENYNFGEMSLGHPKKFATGDQINEYEDDFIDFIDFIEKNSELFLLYEVTDLEIFMEVYYDGGQCNFEIFNKKKLKKLTDFNISLPISIYALTEQEIEKWENETELTWKND